MAICDLAIISGNTSDISAPEGFTRINQDLNQSVGGDYIYLCYREAYTVGPFITDITFVAGDSPDVPAPAGYTRIGVDLNKGAGGKYIYLCYRRGDGPAIMAPLKFIVTDQTMPAITAVPLPAAGQPATGQYSMIPQDLNEGSGGRYIYLCTRRYTETWMEQLAGRIARRPLNRIAIPGTHDSGTYSIDSSSGYAPDDPGIRDWLGDGDGTKDLYVRWSRTQSLSVAEQLACGIRSLDLRVATYGGDDDDIRITHALWGAPIDDILRQVTDFTRRYTKEIVFLHFKYNDTGILSKGSKVRLVQKLRAQLGDLLVPPSFGAAVTPQQLWDAGKRIVVLFDDWIHDDSALDGGYRDEFWRAGDYVIPATLGSDGTMDLSVLRSHQEDLLKLAPQQPARFQRLGCCVTPNLRSTVSDEIRDKATLHGHCAASATPAAVRWLRGGWLDQTVNIFETDFFQLAQTVDTAILRNLRPMTAALHTRLNDFVVDVPRNDAKAGVGLILYPQNLPLTNNQQWLLDDRGYIRSALDPSLVLDIEGGSRQPGTRVILWPENVPASTNQQWDLDGDGYVRSRLDPSLVLDVFQANTAPETPLIVWTKGATPYKNQLFRRVVR